MPDNFGVENGKTSEYLILAGTNKSGTTAVFRYLGDHPSVSVSRQKESAFFYKIDDFLGMEADELKKLYSSQFLNGGSDDQLYVEATPTYLHGGQKIASRVRKVVPNARLLFMLRNPTDRVVSYFRSAWGQPHVATYGLDSDQFVDEAIRASGDGNSDKLELSERQMAFRQELLVCKYAEFLPFFLQEFGADRIHVAFFDELVSSPDNLMDDICAFARIDPEYYSDYEFRVENRTRLHRNSNIRAIAASLNSGLEPFLNRYPAIRRGVRQMYDFVNVDEKKTIPFSAEAVRRLDKYFRPWNDRLYKLLIDSYPDKQLPRWLLPQAT